MKPPLLICFYGPESTGKTTLARKMAEHYRTEYVPEVARELISSNSFSEDDIIRIGRAQTARVKEKLKTAHRVLFCDTDILTTRIYSQTYLGVAPEVLGDLEKELHYDQYFLFDVDIPWVPDGLRDLGEKRAEMFTLFKFELERRGIPFIRLSGNYAERERKVIEVVDAMLGKE